MVKGGYFFDSTGLSVGLSVCLSVSNMAQKVINSSMNFGNWSVVVTRTFDYIFGVDLGFSLMGKLAKYHESRRAQE